MSLNPQEDLYRMKMTTEVKKFIKVYNEVSGQNVLLDSLDEEYEGFVRILGNYIYKKFKEDSWVQTKIYLGDIKKTVIDFSVFKDNIHEDRVKNFLITMKNAFYESVDVEIETYLETTSDFTDDQKDVCRNFYSRISDLNRAIKDYSFSSVSNDLSDKNSISHYKDELFRYNEYVQQITKDDEIKHVIDKFHLIFKNISLNKTRCQIVF